MIQNWYFFGQIVQIFNYTAPNSTVMKSKFIGSYRKFSQLSVGILDNHLNVTQCIINAVNSALKYCWVCSHATKTSYLVCGRTDAGLLTGGAIEFGSNLILRCTKWQVIPSDRKISQLFDGITCHSLSVQENFLWLKVCQQVSFSEHLDFRSYLVFCIGYF